MKQRSNFIQLCKRRFTVVMILAAFTNSFAQQPVAKPLLGFSSTQSSKGQLELESRFESMIRTENMRDWMKRLTAKPHHLGSPHNKSNALFIAELFKAWGYETRLEEFEVLFPTPKTRLVEMTSPQRFRLTLNEPALAQDSTSNQQAEQLPTYNAYSIDGDVSAPLVYVNYGVPADYEELERRGVDVKGKIVIARYGGSWRGIKPKVAAEKGAVGCIIYSDPHNDGFFQGDVYPTGAWRNEHGVQRGSVMDMPLFPGDPLTKGIGATRNAKRIPIKDAPTLTKIPVLPISYSDALPLLRNLDGAVVPQSWRGSLPITYHFGGNSPIVRLKLEFNWDVKTISNVIATMRGTQLPDQWIIRGNHRDAWVNGAQDPISGLVALMEEARVIGQLAKEGIKPKRSIVYAGWDAEEQGLLGSTEWAELHADTLREKAAVYINTDSNGRGFLGVGGSHTLEKFINEVAARVQDPQTKLTVVERARADQIVDGTPSQRKEARERADMRISPLGSGSDFTPFLQHLGIASLNIGFGGENGGGSYHSIYDSFDHFTRFGDPGFVYGGALAKVCGRATLRLANAEKLPFEFVNMAETISNYAKEVEDLAESTGAGIKLKNELISNGMWRAVQDPTLVNIAPKPQPEMPKLDFSPLRSAVSRLVESSGSYNPSAKFDSPELDQMLYKTERLLTRADGLPRRDWFRHQIYAPGFYTGYGVKTLPGVREAIEQQDWNEAAAQIAVIADVLNKLADEIDRIGKHK